MMTLRVAVTTVLASLIVPAIPAAAGDNPADWLNEKEWPALVQPRVFEIQPSDGQLARLFKQRHNAAQDELRERYTFWLQGYGTLDQVLAAARRACGARLEVIDPHVDRLAVLRERVDFAKVIERQAEAIRRNRKRAEAPFADEACARYFRLDAEIELLRAGVELTAERAGEAAFQVPDNSEAQIRGIADVFASLKADLIAMSADYPEFADVKHVAIGKQGITHGIVYEYNCGFGGKRGYKDTGPNALAIGIEVMTFREFSEKVDTVAMQAPLYRWKKLELVGWPTLHFGKDIPETLVKRLERLLRKHVEMIDQLDRGALAPRTPEVGVHAPNGS